MSTDFKKIDDIQLQQMAAEPVRPLFGILDHARGMVPWVILLAILPGLFALANRPLPDEAARWGIKALKSASATSFGEAVNPGSSDVTLPHRLQPPLMSWVSGLAAWSFGQWTPAALMAGPFLATAGFLLAGYALACRIGDAKLGLLTILLLAFQRDLLSWSQTTAPFAAALCFGSLTFWAYLGHLKSAETLLSSDLLIAGVALGCCLLAGGQLAIVILITLVLHALVSRIPLPGSSDRFPDSWKESNDEQPSLRSVGVMALTAFAVGGWWVLMMFYSHGSLFWQSWLTGNSIRGLTWPTDADASSMIFPHDIGELLLILAGPTLYGLWRAVREMFTGDDPFRCRVLQLLVVWTIVAGICWQLARTFQTSATVGEPMWRGFLLIPLLLMAAWGMLQIADGRAGRRAVAVIGLVTAANLIWNAPPNLAGSALLKMFILMILVGALSVVASLSPGFRHIRPGEGRRPRVLETVLVLLMLAGYCVWGLATIPRAGERDQELAAVSDALRQIDQQVVDFTVISPVAHISTPPQIEYLAKSIWPTAPGRVVRSWEEAENWRVEAGIEAMTSPQEASHAHVFILWQASLVPYPSADGRVAIARFQEYYRHRQISVLVLPATRF